jgi:hypothetical protein
VGIRADSIRSKSVSLSKKSRARAMVLFAPCTDLSVVGGRDEDQSQLDSSWLLAAALYTFAPDPLERIR